VNVAQLGPTWRVVVDDVSGNVEYEDVETGHRCKMRPRKGHVLVRDAAPERPAAGEILFSSAEDSSGDEEERRLRDAAEAEAARDRERTQATCDNCDQALTEPLRLARCRCALCACCQYRHLRFFRTCPVCGEVVLVEGGRPVGDGTPEQQGPSGETAVQEETLRTLQGQDVGVCSILLEYGSTARPSGTSKTSFVTFLKVVRVEGSKKLERPIMKVEFNINPGYNKPTSTCTQPVKHLYTFEYTMARAYPCVMTVHFRKELALPPVEIDFEVQDQPKVARRVVVQTTVQQLGQGRPPKKVAFPGDPPRNGFVRLVPVPEVDVLPDLRGGQ